MATGRVLRRPAGRSKHGKSTTTEFDYSHDIDILSERYVSTDDIDSQDLGAAETTRSGKSVTVVITVPNGANLTAQDRIELEDGLVYRIEGKLMPRRNGLTGTVFRTLVNLVRIEG